MKINQNFITWPIGLLVMSMFFITIYNANGTTTDWTGATSTAWSNTLNWTAGVPTSSVDAVIDPTNYVGSNDPTLDGTGLAAKSLTINGAATLNGASSTDLTVSGILTGTGTLSAGASTIYISGDMVVTVFTAGTSTIVLNGSTQSISGYTFYILTIASGTTSFSNSIVVNDMLTVSSGAELTPGASNTITGSGTLTGNGTIDVTNIGSGDNFGNQYGMTTQTLTNLTVQYNGTSGQQIGLNTFGNVTIANSSGISATGTVTIGGTLTLTTGILTTNGSDILIFSSTTPYSGGSNSSFVDGPIENTSLDGTNTSFVFPTGNIDKYAPIGLSDVGSPSSYTVQYFKTVHTASTSGISGTNPTASSDEYWTLIENSGTSAAYVTLYWLDGTYSGINTPSSLSIYYTTGSSWADLGSTGYTGSAGSGSVTASVPAGDMDPTFGYYTFGDDNGANPLPVSLLTFGAQYQGGHVNLNWTTASEQNNAYFDVERSTDAATWTNIGQVQGDGTSDVLNSYTDIDNLQGVIPSGILYYRLKQVDFNGNFTYSMIRSVNINNPAPTVSIYPNPANSVLNVNWTSNSEDNTILKVINEAGQNIYEQTVSGIGMMQHQIDMSALPAGIYFVQVIGADMGVVNQSIVKQ